MANHLIPLLNYRQAAQAVAACLRAKRTALLYGSPGVGKTSLIRDAARAIGKPCHVLIASNLDPTDVAGLPYRGADGHVHRELFPEIRAVVDAPGVLFLDEATTMPKSVEGPMLRLALERNAGGVPLHEDSAVILAANPPEQAPGASDLSAAMINRVVLIRYAPHLDELRSYFQGAPVVAAPNVLSAAALKEVYRLEALDLAATLTHDPSLLVLDPPRASIDASEPWASPRAWEIGLSCYAAHGQDDDVGFALLAGAVGPEAAQAFRAIRLLRVHLPTIDDICKAPDTAIVPNSPDYQIAAFGLLARAADRDVEAAWIYAARLQPEIGGAIARRLLELVPMRPRQTTRAKTARQAQVALLGAAKVAL